MSGKKTTTTLILIFIIIVAQVWLAGAQNSAPRIWITADVQEATAGQEFLAAVNIADANQVYGGSFEIAYDPALLELIPGENNQALTPGAFFGQGPSFTLRNAADPAVGLISYALTLTQPAEPVSGEGQVGVLKFRALQAGPVLISILNPSLVSPEFTQVDGRLVAQSINQVQPTLAPMTVESVQPEAPQVAVVDLAQNAPAVPEVAVPASPSSSASVSEALAAAAQPQSNAPLLTPMDEPRRASNGPLLAAGLLFGVGVVLLTISVGMYSRMRARLGFAGSHLPEYVA